MTRMFFLQKQNKKKSRKAQSSHLVGTVEFSTRMFFFVLQKQKRRKVQKYNSTKQTWLGQGSFRPECCIQAAVDKPSNTPSLGCNMFFLILIFNFFIRFSLSCNTWDHQKGLPKTSLQKTLLEAQWTQGI